MKKYDYFEADKYFVVNKGDADLVPIKISLPTPPDLETIDGFGKPYEDQYFRYKDVPARIRMIEKEVMDDLRMALARNVNNTITVEKAVDLFWEKFEQRRDDLQAEERYIKDIIWYRTYGYWFFNDGKPTWIPPDYFDFLNFWRMQDVPQNGGRPEYRDKDRRKYLYWHYLKTCTETFADLDHEGFALKVNGKYNMIDAGTRVFFGGIEPKTRRSGATHQACHMIKYGVESMFGGYGTIVSMDGENAVVHFTKKFLPALNDYPVFLKARWDGNNTSKSVKYRTRVTDYLTPALNGVIDYTESASEIKNDGDKLHYLLSDEEGKCLSINELALMYDGSTKKVQDIVVGDVLMGDDCTPRTVLNLTRGRGEMYDIQPNKWKGFGCNGNHILTCSVSDGHAFHGKKTGDIIDITVKEFLTLPYWKQKSLCLFKNPIYYHREYTLELEPYYLGIWLGDGNQADGTIHKPDVEIRDYVIDYCQRHGYKYGFDGKYGHRISSAGCDVKAMSSILKRMNLYKNKHIPEVYLKSSYEDRLQLLAGLCDTDGHARALPKPVYEIIQKREQLAYQIQELANSLGFYCSVTPKMATMKRDDGSMYKCPVYRIKIHGEDLYKIPCKIARKKYGFYDNHNKSPRKSGFKIVPVGEGEYYGFELDGNQRFLLPDGTVVHNCSGKNLDILERWNVNKMAQSTGGGSSINGFCLHPSTVENMNEGGVAYRKLCELSNFYKRIKGKGQTFSGLGLAFFPAQDGMENFIDRFGMSVIESPSKRQIELKPDALFARIKMGAYEYLMQERKSLLADGSPRALETYRSMRRKMPMNFAECWIGTSGDMGFDLEKLDQREIELQRKSKVVKGNFKWENDIPDTRVIFSPDENGRWEVSLILADSQTNKKTKVRVFNARIGKYEWQWKGENFNAFTIGGDPVEWSNKSEGKQRDDRSRQSNIGCGVLRERDPEIDAQDDPATWTTRRFVASYSYRPASTFEGNEDILMACVYYGGSFYCENNKTNTLQHFIERGYGGFLQFDFDLVTGRPKDKPGCYATEASKEELFAEIKDYITYHIHIEEHISFIKECKAIRGREEMTRWDRFTAHGWALVGSKRKTGGLYVKKKPINTTRSTSISEIFNAFK